MHPEHANITDHSSAFLAQYSTVHNAHDLFPANIVLDRPSCTFDNVLSALSNGSFEPAPTDLDDNPTWEQAMASDEWEYWIAGGHDELKSLEDLQVFVLVPRTNISCGQQFLKGKLVCKRKPDKTGKIIHYKVIYMVKGFTQCYSIDYDKQPPPLYTLNCSI